MKQKIKRLAFTALLIALLAPISFGQNTNLGIALKGSTTGYGGDVVFQFHERMTARLGVDHMKFTVPFSFDEFDINFGADATIRTGTILALYDFYLAKHIFASAGLGWNNFNINMTGSANSNLQYGDIEIPSEKIGSFDFDFKPGLKLSPYLGIGFGRTLSQTKVVGFAFELGTFIQGSPDVTIQTDGLIAPTSNPDHKREALYEKQLSQYFLYPVLKFNLSFKIINL